MGPIGASTDNTSVESFFSTCKNELLDETPLWASRKELAVAVLEWIEAGKTPPPAHETLHHPAALAT